MNNDRVLTLSRRELLLGAGLSVALSPAIANAVSQPTNTLWKEARPYFGFSTPPRFMNVGTVGSTPIEAQEAARRELQACAASFQDGYGTFLEERQIVAPSFGCSPDELAFTNSTSDGLFRVLFGLSWRPGDEVITTDQEHSGCSTPLRVIAEKYGLVVKTVAIPLDAALSAEKIVALFEAAITPKSKLIVFSSPTWGRGILLPARDIALLAQSRGITTLCDGSHLPGMFPIDARAMGVDFLAGAGHKWQCGPLGTGFLYIRNRVSAQHNNLPLPQFEPMSWFGSVADRNITAGQSVDIAGRVIGLGSRNRPGYVALTKASEIWDRIGRERIAAQIHSNAARLRSAIVKHWGENALYSPQADTRLYSGLISFNPLASKTSPLELEPAKAFVHKLEQDSGFIVKEVPFYHASKLHWAVRITAHFWHGPDDMDQLVDGMRRVTSAMHD